MPFIRKLHYVNRGIMSRDVEWNSLRNNVKMGALMPHMIDRGECNYIIHGRKCKKVILLRGDVDEEIEIGDKER